MTIGDAQNEKQIWSESRALSWWCLLLCKACALWLNPHYDVKRLCFSLKTKSASAAVRASKSINQRLEDYWLGLRLQNMDIPAIQVVKSGDTHENDTLLMSEACELYLRLKGVDKDKMFIGTANRNTQYVTKLLGDRPISSYSSYCIMHLAKNLVTLKRQWEGLFTNTLRRTLM